MFNVFVVMATPNGLTAGCVRHKHVRTSPLMLAQASPRAIPNQRGLRFALEARRAGGEVFGAMNREMNVEFAQRPRPCAPATFGLDVTRRMYTAYLYWRQITVKSARALL